MKALKVVLKSVRFHEGHEGYGVNADVFINGTKVYHVLDDGNGGCLNIDLLTYNSKDPEKVKALAELLNKHIEAMPEKPFEFNGKLLKDKDGKVRMIKHTLEDHINDHLYEYEHKQAKKKMEKYMETGFIFGVPDADSYTRIDFKRPLSSFPVTKLQGRLNVLVLENCKKGVTVLNTNLDKLGLVIN